MMWSPARRPIGQILKDGGFISESQLQRALKEQKQTNERLGEVLVRMGVLEEGELRAALSVQEHLASLEQAVRLAAGVRQMLGTLLVHSGKLSPAQLDHVLAEQQKERKKLGELCVRRGLLSEPELEGLLAFQQHQEREKRQAGPLRLGELLVCAGHITREQLDDALDKQARSRKMLGEVLVEEGYARPEQIHHGIRLQQLLAKAVLAAILSLSTLSMTGCGGGGEGAAVSAPAVSTAGVGSPAATVQESAASNYFSVTSENYPLARPTFYYSTNNDSFWSIQANIATRVTDIDSTTVCRIDIPKSEGMPELNQTFSIEEGTAFRKFPGSFLVFNGEKSVRKRVEKGTITFSPDSSASGKVTGTFDVTLTDYDAGVLPAPQYQLKGSFRFVVGSYGPATGA